MIFTYLFYQHTMFRHSCGKCHFCNTKRPSDITIADFWGWEKTDANINKDDKGVSLVLVNSEKGRRLFNTVRKDMEVIPAELENCLQPNLQHPSEINPNRNKFEHDYKKHGFKYVMYHYGNIGWRYKLNCIKYRIKRKLKQLIKQPANEIKDRNHNL